MNSSGPVTFFYKKKKNLKVESSFKSLGNRVQFDFLRKESNSHKQTHEQCSGKWGINFPSRDLRPGLVAVIDPCSHLTGCDHLLWETVWRSGEGLLSSNNICLVIKILFSLSPCNSRNLCGICRIMTHFREFCRL